MGVVKVIPSKSGATLKGLKASLNYIFRQDKSEEQYRAVTGPFEADKITPTNVYNASIGRRYDALKVVKDAKCVKTTEEAHALNTGLRGFKWKNYPTILTSEKSGKDYIRIETNKNTKFKTTYTMNGKEVSRETISDMLLASEKKHDGEMPVVMNIPMDGIP